MKGERDEIESVDEVIGRMGRERIALPGQAHHHSSAFGFFPGLLVYGARQPPGLHTVRRRASRGAHGNRRRRLLARRYRSPSNLTPVIY